MTKHTISKKKVDKLYKVVHEDIFSARISIALLLRKVDSSIGRQVDDILSDLCTKTPQKAIGMFEDIHISSLGLTDKK